MKDRAAVKAIEHGARVVQIKLFWGRVEWHADNQTITGNSLDGTPFTLNNVKSTALLKWLQGTPTMLAFPRMDSCDRVLLTSGKIVEDDGETTEPLIIPPESVPHPGAILQDYLEAHSLSQDALAFRTGLPPRTIREICEGTTAITRDIAEAFAHEFGRPSAYWLKLQEQYDNAKQAPR